MDCTPTLSPALVWKRVRLLVVCCLALGLMAFAGAARAQVSDPADQVCQRFAAGSALATPPDLRSQNGLLEVTFKFKTVMDAQGLTRYCYLTDTGLEAPTLHLYPGDQLVIHFENDLPAAPGAPMPMMLMPHAHRAAASSGPDSDCAGGMMSPAVTNLHFHGLNVPPTCHQDEVLNTLIQPAATFDYTVQVPPDEPAGLYWYHPHPHGFSNGQVLGGAAGALIVEGIENVNPLVAGLPQRLFVLRDQRLPGPSVPGGPALDVSVNYAPVTYPSYVPVVVQTAAGASEFWRVLNASSNTLLQLQYLVNGVAQPVQVVALDGVPVGQGTGPIQAVTQTSVALPPGARAEFVVATPKIGEQAQLVTQRIDTGRDGASHPARPLASIIAQASAPQGLARLATVRTSVRVTRFARMDAAAPDGRRTLYFSEKLTGPGAGFFITQQGQTPAIFDPGAPPSIVLHQGTTEEWTVENRSTEEHVFHIHQTRFQLLAVNGAPVTDPALRDTIVVPHWSGTGPYPSVTLLMDFRPANIVGLFVYHCHMLGHEDAGMMGAIAVLPSAVATTTKISASTTEVSLNAQVTFTATVAPATAGAPLTGTVQFFDDGAPLGNAVAVADGQAVLTAALPTFGTHAVTAAYSGDAARNQSLSTAVNVAVEEFALSANAATVSKGQVANVPITVAASNGFSSSIDFSCALPSALTKATCTVSPTSLAGSGTITLLVNTTADHKQAALGGLQRPSAPPWLAGGVSPALAGLVLLLIPRRKWRRPALLGMLMCAVALLAVGCGDSDPTEPGTPSGTYSVSVTGKCGGDAAPITHTVVVSLRVL